MVSNEGIYVIKYIFSVGLNNIQYSVGLNMNEGMEAEMAHNNTWLLSNSNEFSSQKYCILNYTGALIADP